MTRAPHLHNRIAVAALRFAAATALFALTQLAAAADPPRSVLRFEKAMIVDATGFEAPMAATTLFLPAGWKTQGLESRFPPNIPIGEISRAAPTELDAKGQVQVRPFADLRNVDLVQVLTGGSRG